MLSLRLLLISILKLALILLLCIHVCQAAGFERGVGPLNHEVVVVVGRERDAWVAIVGEAAERLDAVRALDALRTHARKQIQHPVVVGQVVKVRVELGDEAVRGAAQAASQLGLGNPSFVDPGWIAADLARSELGPCDERVAWLLRVSQLDEVLVVAGLLEAL